MRRTVIKNILEENGIRPRKGLGQSFLIPESVAKMIVEAAEIKSEEKIVEIGPGLGILTEKIARRAKSVMAVEIDPKLYSILKERIQDNEKITFVNEDFLKINLREISQEWGKKLKVMGNLPYGITKPILMQILQNFKWIDSAVVMVQEEVARRICAPVHKKEFGALSLFVQYYSTPKLLFRIPPEAFYPRPAVWSRVVRLTIRSSPTIQVKDEKLFFKVIHSAFSQRRKMLRNVFKHFFLLDEKAILQLETNSEINLRNRGETLSLEEFGRLADCLFEVGFAYEKKN